MTERSEAAPTHVLLRTAGLGYGLFAYAVGVAGLLAWILAMLGLLPFTGGPVALTGVSAGLFNLGLMIAFALQHSIMARPAFKKRWLRLMPAALERSTFVLATGLVLVPVVWLWQPMPWAIWTVESPIVAGVLVAVALGGWAYLFLATFAFSHFELFGLRQVWQYFRGQPITAVPFRERWMYRFDRHPIMTGALIGMWVTPAMGLDHLLFAAFGTIYIVIGVFFEERALVRQWGPTYQDYRSRVWSIVPTFSVGGRAEAAERSSVD